MFRRLIILTALLAPLAWLPAPARAQQGGAVVVTTCASQTLTVGKTRAVSQDTTGDQCVSIGGGTITVTTTPLTPTAPTNIAVATGGTAVTVLSGGSAGGYVTNPLSAAGQGLATAENLYVDYANTPGSTDATCSGTCTIVTPGNTYAWSALANTITIQVNAASNGHKFSGSK